jgi:hypothetical protein
MATVLEECTTEEQRSVMRFLLAKALDAKDINKKVCSVPGVQFPAGRKDFSLLRSVQTDSGAHPTSYTMDTGGDLPHSPPSSVEVKNGGAIPPLSHMSSWHSP